MPWVGLVAQASSIPPPHTHISYNTRLFPIALVHCTLLMGQTLIVITKSTLALLMYSWYYQLKNNKFNSK